MQIIIVGGGKVGSAVANQLSNEQHDITLIDREDVVLNSAIEKDDILTVCGNGASLNILKQANVQKADLLIALTNQDEINLLTCFMAKSLNSNIQTIARVRDPEYIQQAASLRDKFGLNYIVNPEQQAAREIFRLVKYPGFLKRDTFLKGRVEIVELPVHNKLVGLQLSNLKKVTKAQVLVCTVVRNNDTVTADGNCVLQENDHIYVTGTTENLSLLLKDLDIISSKAKNIMIIGGSKIAYYLCQYLKNDDISIKIIDNDLKKCENLSVLLPNTTIVNIDASNLDSLKEEGLDKCDSLINLTGMDEINLLTALFGESQKIPQIITKIDHIKGANILNNLPLGSIISPKDLCCGNIVRYVRALANGQGSAITVHKIANAAAEAIEFVVDENTKYLNTPLKSIPTKKGIIIASISSGTKTTIANGDSIYKIGDNIVVVDSNPQIMNHINDIFEE